MKKIHEKLYCLINELNAICGTLDLFRKGLDFVVPRVPVDLFINSYSLPQESGR